MANYDGNWGKGGVKLSDRTHKTAARSFWDITGGMGLGALLGGTGMGGANMSSAGMGLDALLGVGAGGNMPLLSSAGTDPVLSGLALAGDGNPLAALMGAGGAADPSALLAGLLASGAGTDAGASSAPNLQAEIYKVAVSALQDPEFAELFVRTNPSALKRIVELLVTTGTGGGGAVG